MANLKVEVYRGQIVPYHWFWRIRWENGRVAATSGGYRTKETAIVQAEQMAAALGVAVEVIAPCVI